MYTKIIVAFILALVGISHNCYAEQPLLYGAISHNRGSHVLDKLHQQEAKAINQVFKKELFIKYFSGMPEALKFINYQPNKLAFFYAKEEMISKLKNLPNWHEVAQVCSMNPDNKQCSNTYSSYILTSTNAPISTLGELRNKTLVYYNEESLSNYIALKKLLDAKKIVPVHWLKANSLEEALRLVSSNKADAIGVWDYLFPSISTNQEFKIIYKISNLINPVLFANTNLIDPSNIEKIGRILKQKGENNKSNFSYI